MLPVCRFFSDQSFAPKSSHFYTPYVPECEGLQTGATWKYEGRVFQLGLPTDGASGLTCGPGTASLYRLYNNGHGSAPNHRYTSNLSTVDLMVNEGWIIEGDGLTKVFACVPD